MTLEKPAIHDAQHSAPAGPQAADAARLLARADLLHLDADAEALGEDLYQLAEIDAFVGDIVEYGLDLVALVLHVADLHVQSHVGGDLPRLDHGLVFEGDRLLPALDVVGLGLAVNLAELAVERHEARAPHLAQGQLARERHDADVMPRRGLHGHHVAALERQVVHVAVEAAARILEPDLEDVRRHPLGIAFEPGCFVQFEAAVAEHGLGFGVARAERASAPHLGRAAAAVIWFGRIHRRQ